MSFSPVDGSGRLFYQTIRFDKLKINKIDLFLCIKRAQYQELEENCLNVKINCVILERVKKIIYLGLIIDKIFKFKVHSNFIVNKISNKKHSITA